MRISPLIVLFLAAIVASAAGLDGTWKATMVTHGGKKAAANQDRVVELEMHLKTEGDKATGTVTTAARKRAASAQIVESKVTGNSFTFTTVQKTKKGEQRFDWRGTVDGETMTGTRSRAGGKRAQEYTAKRS
jgi:hypothetical protein